ncbi:MAG: helix-turn-helix transcriptional regulator [Oscillospiraceae bacterium]|nr:helix-turn-helix transcriptional regulator [Oscillospiraceae bacterium]
MKEKLGRVLSKLSLFWRYFILLGAVVLVFLLALTTATGEFTKALRTSYLEQARGNFEQNCQLFVGELFNTRSLPVTVENSADYSKAAGVAAPVDTRELLYLVRVRDAFAQQCTLMDLPAESFLYFRRSQSCLTRYRFFAQGRDCFENYLKYDKTDVTDMLGQEGLSSLSPKLLPAETILVGEKPGEYLTLLVKSAAGDAVYGFLYPAEAVASRFRLDALPANTSLQIINREGNTLFSHGDPSGEQSDYIQLSCDLPALGSTAHLGIPRSYFRGATRGAQTVAQLIFVLSVLIGVAMCFLFSHISVRPFRRLIQVHDMDRNADRPENELAAIDTYLRSAKDRNVALRSMLLSSLLVRTVSGLSIAEAEYEKVSAAFPVFQQPLRVAIVRDRAPDHTVEDESSMINMLRRDMPEQFLCEYINLQEAIILLPAAPRSYMELQDVLRQLNGGMERQARFVCGVSMPFEGLGELNAAIRQAQFCIPETGEYMVLQAAEGTAAADIAIDVDLKQFRQALACWNQNEALMQIEQIAVFAGKGGGVSAEELFYSVLFLLRDTAHSGKLSFEAYEKLTYQHTGTPATNIRRLKAIVSDLFEQKAALQMSDKRLMCEEIVQHIKTNFFDPGLCMASVSKRFCVSERFVYNAVQEITGVNMSTLLTQTRMEEAARLLRETGETISSVAEKCGYTVESTFYRNFKKYYNVTPVEYKNAIGQAGQTLVGAVPAQGE